MENSTEGDSIKDLVAKHKAKALEKEQEEKSKKNEISQDAEDI